MQIRKGKRNLQSTTLLRLDDRGNSFVNPKDKDNLSEMIDSNYNEMQKKYLNSISPKKV